MSAILKAVLSHYIAKKDAITVKLQACINNVEDDTVEKAVLLFKELTEVEATIQTVNINIDFNNKKSVNEVSDLIKQITQVIPTPEPTADREIK